MGTLRWPMLKAKDLERIVRRHCTLVRQKGSHKFYEGPEGNRFTFGFHDGETVVGGLVRKVLLTDVRLTEEEAKKEVGL